MKTATTSIGSLLDRVNKAEIRLPEIQRAYVWKPAQVAGLIDSLYRSYPSGSLLLWETEVPVRERVAAIQGPNQPPLTRPQYLLDGQQRLTSLFRVWEGDDRARVIFNVETERFQIESATTKKDKRWIGVHELLRGKVGTFALAGEVAAAVPSLSPDEIHRRLEKVKKILEYPYHVEIIENLSYEEVTQIFVRVNSKGRALRQVDLALATLSARWPGVIEKLEQRVEQHRTMGYRHLDVAFLARSLSALATDTARLDGFAVASTDRLEEAWKRTERGLEHLLPLLRQNAGIATSDLLPSVNALVPLVAYLGQRQDAPMSVDEANALIYWLFGAFLLGRYNQSVDTVISQDVAAVRSNIPLRSLLKNLGLLQHRLVVTEDSLALRGANSPYFLFSYLVARQRGATDWFFGVKIDTQLEGSLKLEYHHIHPRARLKDLYSKAQINDLANLAFVSGKANRKISNRKPADYFPELSEDDLSRHLVPLNPSLRSPEMYIDFVAERRQMLADAMTKLLDSYRPGDLDQTADPALDPAAGDSLEINVYSTYPEGTTGMVVFVARTEGIQWRATTPLIDWIGFIEDLENGLAARLLVGSDSSVLEGGAEVITVGMGPLDVVGTLQEWRKVLVRELSDVNPLNQAPDIRTPPPWEDERLSFPIMDSD